MAENMIVRDSLPLRWQGAIDACKARSPVWTQPACTHPFCMVGRPGHARAEFLCALPG